MATDPPAARTEPSGTDSLAPRPKVAAAGIAGAVAAIVLGLIRAIARVDVPPEMASAITTVFAFGAGYLKKE